MVMYIGENVFYNSTDSRMKCILALEQYTFDKRLKNKSESAISEFLNEYYRNKYRLTLNCRYETLIFYWDTLIHNKMEKEKIKYCKLVDKKDTKIFFISNICDLIQLKKCFTIDEKEFNTLYRKMKLTKGGTYTNGYEACVRHMIDSVVKACKYAIHTQTGILLVWMY